MLFPWRNAQQGFNLTATAHTATAFDSDGYRDSFSGLSALIGWQWIGKRNVVSGVGAGLSLEVQKLDPPIGVLGPALRTSIGIAF